MLLWCSLISSHHLCHEAAHGLGGFILLLAGGMGVCAQGEACVVVTQHIKPCAALLSVGVNSFSYRILQDSKQKRKFRPKGNAGSSYISTHSGEDQLILSIGIGAFLSAHIFPDSNENGAIG